MKTKIRTFITVCVLAFAGVLNVDAKTENNNLVFEEEKSLGLISTNENFSEVADFQKEAQLMTKQIADLEEAKVTQKVLNINFLPGEETGSFGNEVVNGDNDAITDFRSEAQTITRMVADKEEAKAIQKLVAEGRLAE